MLIFRQQKNFGPNVIYFVLGTLVIVARLTYERPARARPGICVFCFTLFLNIFVHVCPGEAFADFLRADLVIGRPSLSEALVIGSNRTRFAACKKLANPCTNEEVGGRAMRGLGP